MSGAKAQDDSLEAEVFRQRYAKLVSVIQDPESLADGLFSRNIIGSGLLQEIQLDSLTKPKKSRKLLLAVQEQLVVNPCKFNEVMEALQGDSTLEFVVKELQSAYLVATQKRKLEDEAARSLGRIAQITIEQQKTKATHNQPERITESQLLDPQFKLKWKRCADLPAELSRPHLVKINNDVYCGGGNTGKVGTLVFKYNSISDTWLPLPPCPTYNHGLSEFNARLISVGGIEYGAPGFTPTNTVHAFQDSKWVTTLPPMHTARFQPCAFTYNTRLIVCGGVISWTTVNQYTCTSAVEMLTLETGQWNTLAPLPLPLRIISAAISSDRCYLIGGSRQGFMNKAAFSTSLPLLILSLESDQDSSISQPSLSPAIWRTIPNIPLHGATAAELGGCVLALGGQKQGSKDGSTDIHVYSVSSESWRIATGISIPIASYHSASITLAEGSIMVVGGRKNPKSYLNTSFIASIQS